MKNNLKIDRNSSPQAAQFVAKIEALANMLELHHLAQLVLSAVDCEANRINCETNIKPGTKFTKIDVGGSGKLMVDNITGEIFGIKAYGCVHRGHPYGTLDTINEFYWGRYYPERWDVVEVQSDAAAIQRVIQAEAIRRLGRDTGGAK